MTKKEQRERARKNRNKGKAFQRKVAKRFKGENLGTLTQVDVVTKDLSIECKSMNGFVGTGFMHQAYRHATGSRIPIVAVHDSTRKCVGAHDDMIIIRVKDFLKLMRDAEWE